MRVEDTMSDGPRVHWRQDGAVGWIVIDNRPRRNVLTLSMWRSLTEALTTLDENPDVRVAIIRGMGTEAFAAGVDFSEVDGAVAAGGGPEAVQAGWAALSNFRKPLIAMIYGSCMGGGFAVALKADIRLASQDANFSIPNARFGHGYPPHAVRDLVNLVGPAEAKMILFTARRINAADALRLGLTNVVVRIQELEGAALATAETIASNAPLCILAAKASVNDVSRQAMDEERLNQLVDACAKSADVAEGLRAIAEKRSPVFSGR
jgi:enoyl-CoA hydratase